MTKARRSRSLPAFPPGIACSRPRPTRWRRATASASLPRARREPAMPRAEWTLAAALLLAGCATAPPYHPPSVAAPPAYKYGAAWRAAQPGDHLPRGEWWRAFADPELDALMTRADRASPTQIGRAHVCTPGTNAHLVCLLL